MPKSERKILLDFEKPLAELENRINQIRELAKDFNSVDIYEQIHQLEATYIIHRTVANLSFKNPVKNGTCDEMHLEEHEQQGTDELVCQTSFDHHAGKCWKRHSFLQ